MRRHNRPRVWLLNDEFSYPLAAGAMSGTFARPGPGVPTVVDTEAKLSVANGVLTFAGGKVAPDWGDPGIWYGAVTRVAGRTLLYRTNYTTSIDDEAGWDNTQEGTALGGYYTSFGDLKEINNQISIGAVSNAVEYSFAVILRATGTFYFIRGGAYTKWTLLFLDSIGDEASMYPAISNRRSVMTADNIRVPPGWVSIPIIASDSCVRADGPMGLTDGLTAEKNGGGGKAWHFDAGVATIATNKAVITPTLGAELDAGNLVVGTWYSITATQADHFYVGCAVGDTFRAAAATGLDANNKVQAIALSSMFATVSTGTANVKIRSTVAALTAKRMAGVAIVNDYTTPTQGIVARFDGGGNVSIIEFTTATTWNALGTAAKAFTASDLIELDVSGVAWRCYHVTSLGVAVLIASGILTAALAGNAGIWSTSPLNTFSSAEVYAKGNESQYSFLDQL